MNEKKVEKSTDQMTILKSNLNNLRQKLISRYKTEDLTRECGFIMKVICTNNLIKEIALRNPSKISKILVEIFDVGLTLDPSKKLAYIIPRKGTLILDISYKGLIKIAKDSGAISAIHVDLVKKNDQFIIGDFGEKPRHIFDPFATNEERGEIVGGYLVALEKISNNNFYHICTMNKEEIDKIKKRSESFKNKTGPWITDYEEMCKKTLIKRSSKLWIGGDGRLESAIDLLNNSGEGINFDEEQKRYNSDIDLMIEKQANQVEKITNYDENGEIFEEEHEND